MPNGSSAAVANRDVASLPTASAPPHAQTQSNILHPPLKTLACKLAPCRALVDCGGEGACGPNTFSYLLGLLQLADVDGPGVRKAIVDHVRSPGVVNRRTSVPFSDREENSTFGELILLCIEHWPERLLTSVRSMRD